MFKTAIPRVQVNLVSGALSPLVHTFSGVQHETNRLLEGYVASWCSV